MAGARSSVERAAALHRQAAAVADAAGWALDQQVSAPGPYPAQQELATVLRNVAAQLVPGWLGVPLDAFPALSQLPVPGLATTLPAHVRVGVAQPAEDARFPAVVPLLGVGHLAVNGDARDPRVAGLLTSLVLRLVAAAPAGELRVRVVDSTGGLFEAFAALIPAGVLAAPVADHTGLRAVLSEAEEWVRNPRSYTLLVVVAALPELTEGPELARLAALAHAGPAVRLHLVVGGWPPPPLTADTTQPPLAYATQITLRNPYALLGDPPGGTFGAQARLNCPVYLDPPPADDLVRRVCAAIATQAERNRPTMTRLLPTTLWQESAADGLLVDVGEANGAPVTLRLADLTPHWLVGGHARAGRTAFLTNVGYGLSARYHPDALALYLIDCTVDGVVADLAPTPDEPGWLPQLRAYATDPQAGCQLLTELDEELRHRTELLAAAGASRLAGLPPDPSGRPLPRIVCVVDGFTALPAEAAGLLDGLARRGRSCGIHLILADRTPVAVDVSYGARESMFSQFPVRIALPGGGDVLDRANRAADGLPVGRAVVNTAGGLGGPTGASRAHERVVSFPDPHADVDALRAVYRWLSAGPPDAPRPRLVTAAELAPLREEEPA